MKKKILIVEDSVIYKNVYKMKFEDYGMDVKIISTIKEIFDIKDHFDFIMTDWHLSDGEVIDAIPYLKKHSNKLVVVSAFSSESVIVRYCVSHKITLISKPCNFMELIDLINK